MVNLKDRDNSKNNYNSNNKDNGKFPNNNNGNKDSETNC